MTTKAYNRTFPGLVKKIVECESLPAEVVFHYLSGLEGASKEWPSDAVFKLAWTQYPTYRLLRTGRTRMLLEALELGLRNERYHETAHLTQASLHVEHILPQAWQEHWSLAASSPESVTARETQLHNIGNLTLLTDKLNPALQNQAFRLKRPQITQSLLALNAYFQDPKWLDDAADWNEASILSRAGVLFETAMKLWPHSRPARS